MLAVLFIPALCAAAERPQLPPELAQKVRSYKETLAQRDPKGDSGLLLTRQIYEWAGAAAREHNLVAVVDTFGQVMPVRRNEQDWTWRERVQYRNEAEDAAPFSLSAALWSSGSRELLVLTAIYAAKGLTDERILWSSPSIIITRDPNGVVVDDFGRHAGRKGGGRAPRTIYGCQRFIEPSAAGASGHWPDLVMSAAGIGRAEGLQLWQLHHQESGGGGWTVLWKEELLYVQDVTFKPEEDAMSITLLDDVGVNVESHEGRMVFRFRNGRPPAVELVRAKTPQR